MVLDSEGRRIPLPTAASVHRFPLNDLPSRCPSKFSAMQRVDPYWDGVFGMGSQGYWETSTALRRSLEAGLTGHRLKPLLGRAEAAETVLTGHNWKRKLRALAAVEMWRTLTAEQVSCISGVTGFTRPDAPFMRGAFEAGLIDIGSWVSPLRRPTQKDWLVRLARGSGKVFNRYIAPQLTYPEWVSVTAGHGWDEGGQYTRHNILAAELALRAAEFCGVGTVMGEKLATVDLLAGVGVGRDIVHQNRAADAVIVRPDGLRIAIELTASTSHAFKSKVERWAQTLAASPYAGAGLVVLFVIANPSLQGPDGGQSVRELAAKTIRAASLRYPGRVGDRVAERMLLVNWRDWFPEARMAGDGFVDMACQRPTGPASAPWEWVDLLGEDRIPFQPWDRAAMSAVVLNAQGLAGVPTWLRDPERGRQMWPELHRLAGVTRVPSLPAGRSRIPAKVPDRLMML